MHALTGAIPRAYRDHRTTSGRVYGAYVRAMAERFGTIAADALPLVREAGRLVVDLERLSASLETAIQARRRRDQARLRRQSTIARSQLLALEQRLEERLQRRPKASRLAARLRQPATEDGR